MNDDIQNWNVPTKDERETILIYDELLDQWHVYTDVRKHVKKYEKYLDESKQYRKGYSTKGVLSMLDGCIKGGNVSINKKRTMTEEQRKQASERLKTFRQNNKA